MKKRYRVKNRILIIDIETSGFLKQKGCIVEVGITRLNLKNGKTKIVYDSLCKEPQFCKRHTEHPYGWIFSNSDLTFEEVMEAPSSEQVFAEVQEVVNRYSEGCTAYNRQFDVDFLSDRGVKFGKLLPCPMKQAKETVGARNRMGGIKFPTVEETWHHLFPDSPYIEAHRGADDAKHEAKIIYELIQRGVYY